jgi:hypothetical protein
MLHYAFLVPENRFEATCWHQRILWEGSALPDPVAEHRGAELAGLTDLNSGEIPFRRSLSLLHYFPSGIPFPN